MPEIVKFPNLFLMRVPVSYILGFDSIYLIFSDTAWIHKTLKNFVASKMCVVMNCGSEQVIT